MYMAYSMAHVQSQDDQSDEMEAFYICLCSLALSMDFDYDCPIILGQSSVTTAAVVYFVQGGLGACQSTLAGLPPWGSLGRRLPQGGSPQMHHVEDSSRAPKRSFATELESIYFVYSNSADKGIKSKNIPTKGGRSWMCSCVYTRAKLADRGIKPKNIPTVVGLGWTFVCVQKRNWLTGV